MISFLFTSLILSHSFFFYFAQQCQNDFCVKIDSFETAQIKFQANVKPLRENCFCNDCDRFNDCCEDLASKQTDEFKRHDCNVKINDNGLIYSISTCDQAWPYDEVREKCDFDPTQDFSKNKFVYQLPIYSYLKNFTYKNIFCAKCNFESVEKLKPYELNIEDEIINKVENCFEGNKIKCKYSYIPEGNFKMRRCIKSIDYCPKHISDKTLINKCSNHTAYRYYYNISGIEDSLIVYKNRYCAKCHGINVTSLSCFQNIPRKLSFLQSMQVLFDLSDYNGNIHVGFKGDATDKIIGCDSENNTVIESLVCFDYKNNNSLNHSKLSQNQTIVKITKMALGDTIKSYITFLGNIISILSLIILLLVYSIFKNLRNLAGKILMSLSASLLFAQIFFLISNYISKDELEFQIYKKITLCYLFGLLTHYFYLTYFAWSNIMSFDLFITFYSTHKKNNSTKTFIKYSVYAWTLPFVILVILFTVRLSIDNQYQIYALNVCFLTYKQDLLIFFITPVSSFLILNLIFFIMSIVSIRNVDRSSNFYLKKSNDAVSRTNDSNQTNTTSLSKRVSENELPKKMNQNKNHQEINFLREKTLNEINSKNNDFLKQRLILFLKLFILMGCCWCTSVLNSFFKETYVWYIYIVVNSLQGFLIFITIIFNRKTIKEIRKSRLLKYLFKD